MTSNQERASDIDRLRATHLSWRHGAANLAWLVVMHAALLWWFWLGRGLLPFALYAPVSVLAAGVHQRLLSEWFHEATHWNLLPDRRWNDRLADLLIGIFNGARVIDNRPGHFRHHAAQQFFLPDDPDTADTAVNSRAELVRGVLLDLCGYRALRRFLARTSGSAALRQDTSPVTRPGWLALLALLHGGGIALTVGTGRADIYPLYFLGVVCVFPLLDRFRLYGQHATIEPNGSVLIVGSATSRTLHAGLIEQLLINSPVIMYHHEHHARPALPYRALRAIATRSADPNVNGRSCFAIARHVLTGLA